MIKTQNKSKYSGLEDRCYNFAKRVRLLFKTFDKRLHNIDDIKQVIRSSGSVGANYIEANQALGTKDFIMRLRISKKEAKESTFWLKLIYDTSDFKVGEKSNLELLIKESVELTSILGAIYHKMK